MSNGTYTLEINDEGDGMLWCEVVELPGCFASGKDLSELVVAVREAIGHYLDDSDLSIVSEDCIDDPVELHPSRLTLQTC